MGSSCTRRDSTRRCMGVVAPACRVRMVENMARRGVGGGGDRDVIDCVEGKPARPAVVFRAGPKSCAGTLASTDGGCVSDFLALSAGCAIGVTGDMAFAVWCGNRDRRGVFGGNRSGDGHVFYDARRSGGRRSGKLGQCAAGSGLRRTPHRVRNDDCEEARWVGLWCNEEKQARLRVPIHVRAPPPCQLWSYPNWTG